MSRADSEFITGKPVELSPASRQKIESAIEKHLAAVGKLTALLDQADGDENLEDGGDYEETADDEASLGWSGEPNQIRAVKACIGNGYGFVDVEAEHDGREPSLGSTMAADQARWADGASDDREVDAGDEPEAFADDDLTCEDEGGAPFGGSLGVL